MPVPQCGPHGTSRKVERVHIIGAPVFWLLALWEDSPVDDFKDAETIFRLVTQRFGHDAAIVQIPLSEPVWGWSAQLGQYLYPFSNDTRNLYILYYIGHGVAAGPDPLAFSKLTLRPYVSRSRTHDYC